MLPLPPGFPLSCRRLNRADLPALQALCAACDDYHRMLSDQPARPDEALDVLEGRPPQKGLEHKHVFGLFDAAGTLCGALELLQDYRFEGEWYLGLLLFAPEHRAKGLGAAVVRALLSWLAGRGVETVRLAVAEQNTAARRFWERQGFVPDKTFAPRPMGTRMTTLHELTRAIGEGDG